MSEHDLPVHTQVILADWESAMTLYAAPRSRAGASVTLTELEQGLDSLSTSKADSVALQQVGIQFLTLDGTTPSGCVLAAAWCAEWLDFASANPDLVQADAVLWAPYFGLRERAVRAFGPDLPLGKPLLDPAHFQVSYEPSLDGGSVTAVREYLEYLASPTLDPHRGLLPGVDHRLLRAWFTASVVTFATAGAPASAVADDVIVQAPDAGPDAAAPPASPRSVIVASISRQEPMDGDSPSTTPNRTLTGEDEDETPPLSAWQPDKLPELDVDLELTLDPTIMDQLRDVAPGQVLRLSWGDWELWATSSPSGELELNVVTHPKADLSPAAAARSAQPDLQPVPSGGPPAGLGVSRAPYRPAPPPRAPYRPAPPPREQRRVEPGGPPGSLGFTIRFGRRR